MNLCLCCTLVWAAGCGGGGGGAEDGGQDGAADDGGPDGADELLEGTYELRVPAATRLCALTALVPPGYAESLQEKVRVSLRAGEVRLPFAQASAEVELVDSVEIGPDGLAGTPTGPGVLAHTAGAGQDELHALTFRQPFRAGGATLEVVGTFAVQVQAGAALPLTLDDALLTGGAQGFRVARATGDVSLVPCGLGPFTCAVHDLTLEGGDRLQIEACAFCPPDWLCKASLGGLRRAEFDRTRVHRDAEDYFLLAHVWAHHDWGQTALVVLEPAVGTLRAIALETAPYPDHARFATATYLDATLSPLETRQVTAQSRRESW